VRSFEGHEQGINDATWSPDAQYIASVSDDRSLRMWHAATVRADRVASRLLAHFR
jgi:COMPASS component SWD3